MISDLLKLPLYDRITCMLFTFYSFVILQSNMRSYYKRLWGISSTSTLDWIYWFGMAATVSLPVIGYCDEDFGAIHGIAAVIFFTTATFSIFWISNEMVHHKDKLPGCEKEIATITTYRFVLLGCALALGVSFAIPHGHDFWVPFFEWSTTLLLLSCFGILAQTNPFYDSIH